MLAPDPLELFHIRHGRLDQLADHLALPARVARLAVQLGRVTREVPHEHAEHLVEQVVAGFIHQRLFQYQVPVYHQRELFTQGQQVIEVT